MKKKVFSLMMTLLLAFIGVAKADVVTIGDPTSTTTNAYLPGYTLYDYSISQQIYTADEIGMAGTINTLTMWLKNSSSYARNINVYMKEVSESTFASATSWVSMTASDMVASFTMPNGVSTPVETAITLSTPFAYSGNGNLVICFQDVTGQWSSGLGGVEMAANGNQAIYAYRDGTVYDPTTPGVTGTLVAKKNVVALDITPGGGGGAGAGEQIFAYQDGVQVDTVFVGPRPNGCWMEPFTFQIHNDGAATTITNLDWTPEEYFTLVAPELPVQIGHDEDIDVLLNTGESNYTDWQMVAIYGTGRTAAIWNINVEPYNPAIPDVVEMAYDLGTVTPGFSYQGIPSQITPTELHNDYTLPFPEIEEGVDAVYKFTVDNDVIISANVDENDENGKVALYTEDFYGQGGPMADNNYQGLNAAAGGGAAAGPFEAQLGTGTSTSGYMPFYCFYNYSISQQLYLAAELQEAGVTRAPMTSLSWYCTASNGNLQSNITIWMGNVDMTSIGSSSEVTGGMTKVYEGNMTPTANQWNEFIFNQGSFAWDGHSSILVSVQRNNGAWASGINWQVSDQDFTASGYSYNDSDGAYNMATTSYTFGSSGYSYGGTTTNRANTIMKGGNREGGNRDLVEIGEGTGTTYYFPIDNYFNYSCTEQIYTADEIGTAGTINSISFYYNYGTAYTANNVTMYMKNVTRDSFASTTDCEPLAASDVVWTGSIAPTAAGWYTFDLDTPFQYDGTSNLLVAFYDGTSGYPGTSYTWRQTTSPNSANMALRYYSDSTNPDPYNLASYGGSKTLYTYRSNIQLNITPGGGSTALNVSAGPVIENLGLTAGTYYLVASATQADYTVNINVENMPCPIIADAQGNTLLNPEPADNADDLEPASVTLRWMVPEYATAWRLIFGSTYHPEPSHPQTVMTDWSENMANSYTVTNLWNNTNYFWRVEFKNDGCPDGVSSPVWGFTTHLNVPQNLTAVDYTVFNDETITLNWNAVVDRTYRFYNVYRDGELIGSTQVNNIGATTYTDGPLAYNMAGYVYYVTAVYDEGESAPSNTVTVKVSGYGDVNGHVYEQDGTTGIANATVTMIGTDEFGDSHTYNLTTNAQGYYSGHIYAGTYNGQASCTGYQTIYEPVQGNPININYNQTASPYDYILDENFDPVCAVIAEYFPDSLDPNSPFVKVYWGCGLPGSDIIEPFETGDFSLFDWQIDPTYPWSITTTNPYEGQYCMKSGGAGVANVVSNMTVEVEIPADGLMSFYGKISCESSWDYGYFYIDGVQRGSYTGNGNWAERTFDITAGTHTFQWRYTKDGSVNSNDDCFYVDYISFYKQPEPAVPGMTYDFEDSSMQGWTSVDADGDGFGWYVASEIMSTGYGHNGSNDCVLSQSYSNSYGALYPDNYLVSPQVQLGGIVRFYACAQDASYAAEHFGVAVSTTNTNPSSFTMVQEWTMSAKSVSDGGKAAIHSRSGRAQGEWYEYTVDLSAYSGNGYVAIRHFNCTDMFYLDVDDITIGEPGKGMPETRSLDHYRVYRTNCYNDGPYTEENTVLLATVWVPDTVYIDVEWADLPAGVYKWGVGTVYSGNRGEEIEGEISWTEPVAMGGTRAEFTYGFEGGLDGWTVIDVNANEGTWLHSDDNPGGYDYTTLAHGGSGFAMCYSYVDYVGAYSTNSYLVSPQKYSIGAGSTISFFADNANDSYPENFSICVATAANPTAADFTEVWNGGAKAGNAKAESRHMADRYENWRAHIVDLSAYAGQEVWIAFHDVNYDQYEIWIDDVTITAGNGGGGGNTGGNTNNLNQLALERESETVWSNCLDKDMYLDHVSVNVLLNSADSPEGTTVTFTNYNEYEQLTYGGYDITLDESGYYLWDNFRKGEYQVVVEHVGYETIYDSVSIWTPTDLRYVMIEIIYGVENLYVSRTGWAMWDSTDPQIGGNGLPGGGGGGTGGGNGDTFSVDFEGGLPADWTVIDGNNDGYTWCATSAIPTTWTYYASLTLDWYHSGSDAMCSGSYINGVGAINPDEYLVSPQVNIVNGSTFSFWAAATDASYAADHFGVFVSDNGTDWTMVNEWTLTAKSGAKSGDIRASRDGAGNRLGNWYNYSVDLSAYAGQKYIAIRHFNCYDQYIMCIDDVELTTGAKSGDRHLEYYKVMCTSIDGVPIFNHNTIYPFCQLSYNEPYNAPLVEGEHYLCKVACMYSTGQGPWCDPVEWVYEPCDHWGPVDEVNVDLTNQGNHIEWTFENGFNPYAGGGAKGGVEYEAFESGMLPNGTYALNITDVANFDERVIYLHNLSNDVRFDVINGEAAGMFIVSPAAGYEDINLEEAIAEFGYNNNIAFGQMEKAEAAMMARTYKAEMPMSFVNSLMMDMYIQSRENNMCEFADPFCTDNGMYEFPAGVNAGSGEPGPYYDCLYSTPNPAWYYMRIGDPGDLDIYMYSTPQEDIDFCCWGPFDDPTTPCPNGLTADKVVDCSYSIYDTEHCIIENAQSGEYYILVITNYSNSPCNINFSMVNGTGSTDCGILPPVDIIGFLITMDGEYLAFASPTDRDFMHEGEFGEHEYCVRPIYPGEMTLPDHNYGWSMGCPVCQGAQGLCAAGAPIYGEALVGTEQIRIWWGENPDRSSGLLKYNVYRSTSANGNYTLIGEVEVVEGMTYYEYIDTPETSGSYYYQVRADYGYCESEPAISGENPAVNYVIISTTGVDELNGNIALYPNPTNGNVTIKATAMQHVTVVSLVGQVLYDMDVDTDEMIINMAEFESGMYMVRIATTNGVSTHRVTVVR